MFMCFLGFEACVAVVLCIVERLVFVLNSRHPPIRSQRSEASEEYDVSCKLI
jgi:hypothetical protein